MKPSWKNYSSLTLLVGALLVFQGCSEDSASKGSNKGSATANKGTGTSGTTTSTTGVITAPEGCADVDKDGFLAGTCAEASDCNDRSASINPDAKEVCGDGFDNNCNDVVDEECPCATGELRLCSSAGDPSTFGPQTGCKPGVQRCIAGAWSTACEGEVGPQEETCNNIDDDCDGTVDEELRNPVGICLDMLPPDYKPPEEECGPTGEGDGVDNDGNGQVDETCSCALPDGAPGSASGRIGQPCYSGPPASLGQGVCVGGTRDCVNDTWTACQNEVKPSMEVCGDGLDNNCNGVVDDGCAVCVPTGDETCDGIDNDCDGVIDEGTRNACGGCGEVATRDLCGDGIDNDCNGSVDDGCSCTNAEQDCYAGPPESAGVGICARGKQKCQTEFYGACEGSVLPQLEQCGDGLDNDCDGQTDEGCSCTDGATRPCGKSTGTCEPGTQTCTAGAWGACAGEVGPATESETTCDGLDNDCDGLTDEGLLNACGKCDLPCYTEKLDPTKVGQGDMSVDIIPGNDPDNPRGKPGITLSRTTSFPSFLWAANNNIDQVSKVDTKLRQEVGRYWVGDNPSRTAVDLDGNMWVIGRNDGWVTKILWNEADCATNAGKPQNMLNTSRRVNGMVAAVNGPGAARYDDDCIAFSEQLNENHKSGRGIAVTPDGTVWFGFSDAGAGGIQGVQTNVIKAPVGMQAAGVVTPAYPPTNIPSYSRDSAGKYTANGNNGTIGRIYGLVTDSKGNVWAGSLYTGSLAKFDSNTRQWTALYDTACSPYGIAVDGNDRIWLGCWSGSKPVAIMFDPATETDTQFFMPSGQYTAANPPADGTVLTAKITDDQTVGVSTSALAVEPATGDVWVTHNDGSGVVSRLKFNENNPAQSTFTIIRSTIDGAGASLPGVGGSRNMRGVGFDGDGFAWQLGPASEDAFVLDPMTNQRIDVVTLPGTQQHYTYSDFTGASLFNFTAPRGTWRTTFDTKFPGAKARTVTVEAEVQPQTTLELRVRALDGAGTVLGDWIPVGGWLTYPNGNQTNVFDLSTVGGPLVGERFEIEVRFTTSDRDIRPIIYDIQVGWDRP